MTNKICSLLSLNGFSTKNLAEKVHVMMHLINDLCHEVVYHKHPQMDYDVMTNLVISSIEDLLNV